MQPIHASEEDAAEAITWQGPIGVVLVLVWVLAVAAMLLVKPVWLPCRRLAARVTEASPAH